MSVLDIAKQLGQDVEALKRGETLHSTILVNSLDEFRELFGGGLTDDQRAAFSKGSEGVQPDQAPGITELVHHTFGSGPLTAVGAGQAEATFPAKVQVMMAQDVLINSDLVVGPNAAPYAVLADTLTFKGGSLTVLATALTIKANTLSIATGTSKNPYHVGIFGVAGQPGTKGPDGPPYSQPAQGGSNSSAPTPGICTGASDGGNGNPGAKGQVGSPGGPGNPGTASLPATLQIAAYDPASVSAFIVQTQSGAGGAGGLGGNGGRGQDGGRGGNGCDSGCEGTDGGNGGAAGAGGDGGPGGNGANGTNGYPISISFPNSAKTYLQTVTLPAPPGAGGAGGSGGPAGNPGGGGSGGKHKSDGQSGSGASNGATGAAGTPGASSGAPGAITVNYT